MAKLEKVVRDILVANAKFDDEGLTHVEALQVIQDAAAELEDLFPDVARKVDGMLCPGCQKFMGVRWGGRGECRECRA